MRVIGLDISISGTGYAEWTTTSGCFTTKRFVTYPPNTGVRATLRQRHDRLQAIEDNLIHRVHAHTEKPSLIVVEGPAMNTVHGSHDISGNWWRVIARVLGVGLTVVEVPPVSLKLYATGSGSGRGATKVTKKMVRDAVTARYTTDTGRPVKSSDEADAIILTAIGLRLLGCPVDPELPAANMRAMDTIRLPEEKAD